MNSTARSSEEHRHQCDGIILRNHEEFHFAKAVVTNLSLLKFDAAGTQLTKEGTK